MYKLHSEDAQYIHPSREGNTIKARVLNFLLPISGKHPVLGDTSNIKGTIIGYIAYTWFVFVGVVALYISYTAPTKYPFADVLSVHAFLLAAVIILLIKGELTNAEIKMSACDLGGSVQGTFDEIARVTMQDPANVYAYIELFKRTFSGILSEEQLEGTSKFLYQLAENAAEKQGVSIEDSSISASPDTNIH